MVRWYCLVILLSGLVAGCNESPEKPEMLIDEDTYISLLVELQLVRTYSETDRMDEAAADSLRSEIFREYGVSGSAFWESHEYYQQFPQEQKKRVDEAIERLRKDRMEDPDRPAGEESEPEEKEEEAPA